MVKHTNSGFDLPAWLSPSGTPLSCHEKIKVLNQNLVEIRQMCQDAFEDAVLMEADEKQFRGVLQSLVDSLENPFRKD